MSRLAAGRSSINTFTKVECYWRKHTDIVMLLKICNLPLAPFLPVLEVIWVCGWFICMFIVNTLFLYIRQHDRYEIEKLHFTWSKGFEWDFLVLQQIFVSKNLFLIKNSKFMAIFSLQGQEQVIILAYSLFQGIWRSCVRSCVKNVKSFSVINLYSSKVQLKCA